MFKHKLNFDRANLIFAALSLTLLKVIHALFAVVYAAVDVSDSQSYFFFFPGLAPRAKMPRSPRLTPNALVM